MYIPSQVPQQVPPTMPPPNSVGYPPRVGYGAPTSTYPPQSNPPPVPQQPQSVYTYLYYFVWTALILFCDHAHLHVVSSQQICPPSASKRTCSSVYSPSPITHGHPPCSPRAAVFSAGHHSLGGVWNINLVHVCEPYLSE